MTGKYAWDFNNDSKTEFAYQKSRYKKGEFQHESIIRLEKLLYLYVYLVSDIITTFQLLSIFTLALLGINATYLYPSILLAFSIAYAALIHYVFRKPDFDNQYFKFNQIMRDKPLGSAIPYSTGLATVLTLSFFAASISTSAYPLLSLGLLIGGLYSCYHFYSRHFQSIYTIYLFEYCLMTINHFFGLVRLANLNLPFLNIARHSGSFANGLAVSYALAYFISLKRREEIDITNEQYTKQVNT